MTPTRWKAWWDAHHPRSDGLTLTHRNVYILPTASGLLYLVLLLTLLLASINYQLSLGYALTFLLAASGVASMHLTHANLRGLRWQLQRPEPNAAGQTLRLQIHADNPDRTRWGVGLAWTGSAVPRALKAPRVAPVWVDLAARGRTTVELQLATPDRGWWRLPTLHIETRFPLGLFRAWAVWRPAATATVWPRAETPCPEWPSRTPEDAPVPAASQPARRLPGQADTLEWQGLRAYRPGDAPRLLAWKQMARWMSAQPAPEQTGDPVRPQSPEGIPAADRLAEARRWTVHDWRAEPPAATALPPLLAWSDTADLRDPEARLARLCAWVDTLHHLERPFSLDLPPTALPLGGGEAHRLAALQLLARWGCGDPNAESSA